MTSDNIQYLGDFPNKLITFSYLRTYDLCGPLRTAFGAGKSITRARGRGMGPGNQDFFGPCETASSR
jgi:hypothetical protein